MVRHYTEFFGVSPRDERRLTQGFRAVPARVEAAAMAHVRSSGVRLQQLQQMARMRVLRALDAAGATPADLERWQHEGEGLDELQIAALCELATGSR